MQSKSRIWNKIRDILSAEIICILGVCIENQIAYSIHIISDSVSHKDLFY